MECLTDAAERRVWGSVPSFWLHVGFHSRLLLECVLWAFLPGERELYIWFYLDIDISSFVAKGLDLLRLNSAWWMEKCI